MFSGEKRKGQLNNGSMFSSPLTSRRMKFLTVLLTPANRKNKWWVGAAPEVITLRPTVKMKPQSGALYPDYGTNTNVRRVLWVDRLQFHVLFESARRLVFKIDKRIFLWKREKGKGFQSVGYFCMALSLFWVFQGYLTLSVESDSGWHWFS